MKPFDPTPRPAPNRRKQGLFCDDPTNIAIIDSLSLAEALDLMEHPWKFKAVKAEWLRANKVPTRRPL